MKQERSDFYVYALLNTGIEGPFRCGRFSVPYEPFYIGKGCGMRAVSHIKDVLTGAKEYNQYKSRKILKILRSGNSIQLRIFKHGMTNADALALEIKLIAKIGRGKNGPLTNLTDGGEGLSGHKHSKASRLKMSEKVKAAHDRRSSEEKRELRERISSSMLWTPELRTQISNSVKEYYAGMSDAERAQLSKKRKIAAAKVVRDLKQIGDTSKRVHASRTPAQKKQYSNALKAGHARMTAEEKAEVKRRSWETRRLNKLKEAT